MFPYFSSLKAAPGSDKGAFRVVQDGYVTADAGTGIVHQAPFFGEDDYRVSRKFGELLIVTKGASMEIQDRNKARLLEWMPGSLG